MGEASEVPAATEITTDEGVTDVDPSSEVLPLHYNITAYGADFLVDGLVKRLNSSDIRIPTFDPEFEGEFGIDGFQRGFVWTKPQADKFIESLLLGMPVPGLFLVRQPDGVLLVLDGHQRMRTIQSFYKEVFRGKQYILEYVQDPWRGRTYGDLDVEDRRRLDDSVMHATILRHDTPDQGASAIYSIFERINTGGTPLQPQEIRVALYGGPFISLLRKLNNDANWRALYGARSPRLKDQELILRVLAMYEGVIPYSRPVKGFLNSYLDAKRDTAEDENRELSEVFTRTAEVIREGLGPSAFRPVRSLNAAVLDSVMVGIARRIEARGPITRPDDLKPRMAKLSADPSFVDATSSSTAAEETVERRLRLATAAFRTAK